MVCSDLRNMHDWLVGGWVGQSLMSLQPNTTAIPNLLSSVQWLSCPESTRDPGKGSSPFSKVALTVPWELTFPFIVTPPTFNT